MSSPKHGEEDDKEHTGGASDPCGPCGPCGCLNPKLSKSGWFSRWFPLLNPFWRCPDFRGYPHAPHHPFSTGNRWAGGTGGADTAGLGGRGGPYRALEQER